MAYLLDSNILRHYSAQHPILFENLKRIERSNIVIPITVYAEQLRGRIEGLLKAEPQHLLLAQKHLKATLELLDDFEVLDLNEASIETANRLKHQIKTRKRYADFVIAAQAIAGRHILVTRNTADFQDMLPAAQLQNWVDDRIG
jgi:predicted nucleic acid-binding protein